MSLLHMLNNIGFLSTGKITKTASKTFFSGMHRFMPFQAKVASKAFVANWAKNFGLECSSLRSRASVIESLQFMKST